LLGLGLEETAGFMARESGRPIIRNALLADSALKRLAELNEVEGAPVFAQALTTNFADAIPCWKEALLGTVQERRAKLADTVK
jgi:hypothetical protein